MPWGLTQLKKACYKHQDIREDVEQLRHSEGSGVAGTLEYLLEAEVTNQSKTDTKIFFALI